MSTTCIKCRCEACQPTAKTLYSVSYYRGGELWEDRWFKTRSDAEKHLEKMTNSSIESFRVSPSVFLNAKPWGSK